MIHHLIFEGAELSGKSWLMSRVYDYLEPKYNRNKNVLDGCHWFNCDVGIFGTPEGRKVIEGYVPIFEALSGKNVLVEKFQLADRIYNQMYNDLDVDYGQVEDALLELDFKIILVTFPNDRQVLEKRIADRLSLYPHYERILKPVDWYLDQQAHYRKEIKKSRLPFLEVATEVLPDEKLAGRILEWIGEK